jgi:hypothetical protein
VTPVVLGLIAAFVAIMLLSWRLGVETGRRRAAESALAERREAEDVRAAQLALFERREAVLRPLEALSIAWTRSCRPEPERVARAADALVEAQHLFDPEAASDCEALLALLLDYERHQIAYRAAVGAGALYDRGDRLEREIEIERRVKPALQALRLRLAQASRVPDA